MIQESWFDCLKMPSIFGLREDYSWLGNLPSQVERIANFGCYSCVEPFRLIWTLDAKEVMVVEIEARNIEELRNKEDVVKQRIPESLEEHKIKCICGDMTSPLPELPDQYYDLAYCEDVLYSFQNIDALEHGISQMIRVVKPNGFIVAVESKFGVRFETQKSGITTYPPVPISEPKDMSDLFSSKGLKKVELSGCPPFTYCYRKNEE
jgi:SAM-dependent methyltransferase